MRTITALTAIILFAGAPVLALAENNKGDRERGSDRQPMSIDAMRGAIDRLGYNVRQIQVDDECFKAIIIDRVSGGGVRVHFSIATGELLQASLVD